MITKSASYTHRRIDGVFESICRGCYRTVAVEMAEEYLAEDEAHHTCSQEIPVFVPWSFARWNRASRRQEKKPN